jgi:hypothetical protein
MDAIKNWFSSLKVSSGGVNDTMNGQIYQVELLMYVWQKAQLEFDNYGLSTELEEYGCFDDAILRTKDFTLAVQAKWRKNPKNFSVNSFFSKESEFYLYKYVISFKESLENGQEIAKAVICTNNTLPAGDVIPLSNPNYKLYVSKLSNVDLIFGPFKRFKFGSSDATENAETFNCIRAQFIAIELRNVLNKKQDKNGHMFLSAYKNLLVDKIDLGTKKFKQDIVNKNSTDLFVIHLRGALKEKNISISKSDLSLLLQFFDANQTQSTSEGEMDQLIRKFLSKFELLVDVNRIDFEKEIVPLLQNEFRFENVKIVKSSLQSKIIDWVQKLESGNHFDAKQLSELYQDVRNNLASVKIVDRTDRIFLDHNYLEFKAIDQKYLSFLNESSPGQQNRVLYCQTESGETYLTCLKFYQVLKERLLDTFMFVQTSGPDDYFHEAVDIFKTAKSFKALVIEINSNNSLFAVNQIPLFDFVHQTLSKRLVVISPEPLQSSDPKVDSLKAPSIKLIELTDESLKQILKKEIQFQERPIKLGEIIPENMREILSLLNVFDCKSIGRNVISNEVYKTSKSLYIPRKLRSSEMVICENNLLRLSGGSQDFLIVVNSAGMGKTSLLNHLAEEMKELYPEHWIINIALNDHSKYFADNFFQNSESIADFLLKDFLKLGDPFAEQLFRESLLNEGNVQIILDGLDEIAPNYTEPVMNLIGNLIKLPIEKVIVSTRPELGDRLEREFQRVRCEILPFTRAEQETFLITFWKGISGNLRDFSKKLLDAINETVADSDFTGTPLTTKLIGEIYKEQAASGLSSDKIEGASNLFDLFNKLLKEKVEIICSEKSGTETTKVQAQLTMENEMEKLVKICQKLALPILFSSDELKNFPPNHFKKITEKEFMMMLKYGFITGQLGSEKFIHKTIAEFFGVLYLVVRLDQEGIFIFFVSVVLTEKRFQVIRAMFDSFLKTPADDFDFSSHLAKFVYIPSKFQIYSSALGVACEEGNSKTVEALFISLIDVSDPQELIEVQKTLTSRNSFLLPYFASTDDEFKMLNKVSEKFGLEFVEEIFFSKFDLEDGSETDILSFALLSGKNLEELMRFVKNNFFDNSNFLSLCFCQPDKSGLNFVQKTLNSNFSKIKILIFVELFEIIKSDEIYGKIISRNFQEHFEKSSPENSLFFDALKVGNAEAFKLIVEFVESLENSPDFLSKFLQTYFCEFSDKIDFLDILGPKETKELVIRENQNTSQILDHDLIENFYRNVLNYFDGKTSPDPETSSLEQLKLEAFRQLSVEFDFQSFVRRDKEPGNFNQILLDLEILRETSDGFSFANNRNVVEVFGFARFYEILQETDEFKRNFILPQNIEIESLARFLCLAGVVFASKRNYQKIEIQKLKKNFEIKLDLAKESILARNSNGQSFFHFLVDSKLQKPLIIQFIDFLKVHFGAKFIPKILTLKNSEGFTFWSHSFANRNISSLKELKFETFLEDILSKLCGDEIDFANLNKLAFDLVFERKNLEKIDKNSSKKSELFELEILTELGDEVKFSDSSFLNYFAFKGFYENLIKNYKSEESAKLCSKLLSEKEKFNEICWLIEKLFGEELIEGKLSLSRFARIGEENENLFFLLLEILLNRLKTKKDSKIVRNLFFKRDGDDKQTFLHQFCRPSVNWNESSFEKLFGKFKKFRKYFPEKDFKELLMIGDHINRTFLFWLDKFSKFEIAFNFLISEFELDFVQDFLLIKSLSGYSLYLIKFSINEFTQVLNLFKNNFDEKFVKKFLMQKNNKNENFLLYYEVYSNSENSSELLKLLNLIFSIFGADLELFNDLFYSKSKVNETFFEKLTKRYNKTELNLITDWMKKNLGRNFLKRN